MKLLEKIKEYLHGRHKEELSKEERAELIRKMLTIELFAGFSEEMLTKLLNIMEYVSVKAEDVLIRQGEEGDYYYLLARGAASVVQRSGYESQQRVIVEVVAPASIGEDALISNAKRNATVMMKTDGVVFKLSKEDFNIHVRNPILKWVSPSEARELLAKGGAKWLDVREQGKKVDALQGEISIPFSELRARISELDRETFYLCYCDNGRISATAAFLLSQRGLKAGVLRGGLNALNQL